MIDLRSDTVTQPTKEMLEAMMHAKTGDDVFMEDPTVVELETKLASMFSKEAGIFCPSGTMTNQIAIRMHTQPGQEVICHKDAHVYKYEGGGIAVNSNCSVRLIEGNRGMITTNDVLNNINNPEDVHLPLTHLVCLEDTMNRGGGCVYDFEEIKKIRKICEEKKFKLHLDGARVFNALVENGIDKKEYGKPFDSVSICLSKGLGAPVGSVLVGTKDDIKKARRIRKVFGGGMRQVGYLAAAGLFAIENNITRLKDDHKRAKYLGEISISLSYVEQVLPVETNIVVLVLKKEMTVENFLQKMKDKNVLAVAFGPQMVRMVTHLDITDEMIAATEKALKSI